MRPRAGPPNAIVGDTFPDVQRFLILGSLSLAILLGGCARKPVRSADFAGFPSGGFTPPPPPPPAKKRATIVNAGELYSSINLSDCITWPSLESKRLGGANAWGGWHPANGMSGVVIGTSSHCNDPSVTVYVIDFGDDHIAALNQKGLSFSDGGGGAPPPAPVATAGATVRIVAAGKMFDLINTTDCLTWPSPTVKALGGSSGWGAWKPQNGDLGAAIGKTKHCNQKATTVVFVKIGSRYVAIDEKGIEYVSGSPASVPWVTPGTASPPSSPPPPSSTAGAGTVESGRVRLVDVGEVYASINTSTCLEWPDDATKALAGSNAWGGWSPKNGDVGVVVWKSTHCTKGSVVLIVRVGENRLVAIGKNGVAPE